jgi:nucleoid-associated protein YgaU
MASIRVQQPEPFDLVGGTVLVAGLGTGFEATLRARVRDGNSNELVSTFFMVGGGTGEIAQFHAVLELPEAPPTPNGFVEVWEDNAASPDGPFPGPIAEINKVCIPIVFGTHLMPGYVGYRRRIVLDGDSLGSISQAEYGDSSEWARLHEANRDQIGNPSVVEPGMHLRIPH